MNNKRKAPARQSAGLDHFPNIYAQNLSTTALDRKNIAIGYRLTGSRCRCATCGQRFNSVSVFDRHRVGSWEMHGALRRCLSVDEMVSRGWSLNARGFWIERPRLDVQRGINDRLQPLMRKWA